MEVIGITPQRVGQTMASETAQGNETAVNSSYVQTEMLFVQHCDWLMPRVHSMRTDVAQYYHSKKPSLRLQYVTSMDEKVNFQMNTTGMLTRDVGVHCTTEISSRDILNKLKQFFYTNNTNGGNMHDLSNVMKVESLAEMDRITKAAQDKVDAQIKAQQDHEQKMNQDLIAAEAGEKQAQRDWDANENLLDRESNEREAMFKGAGAAGIDTKGGEDDYLQRLNFLQKDEHFNQKMNHDREKENNKTGSELRKEQLKREELQAKIAISKDTVNVARTNKNKFDSKPKSSK